MMKRFITSALALTLASCTTVEESAVRSAGYSALDAAGVHEARLCSEGDLVKLSNVRIDDNIRILIASRAFAVEYYTLEPANDCDLEISFYADDEYSSAFAVIDHGHIVELPPRGTESGLGLRDLREPLRIIRAEDAWSKIDYRNRLQLHRGQMTKQLVGISTIHIESPDETSSFHEENGTISVAPGRSLEFSEDLLLYSGNISIHSVSAANLVHGSSRYGFAGRLPDGRWLIFSLSVP